MEYITNYNYVNKILEFWFEKKIDYIKWFKSNNKYDKYITEEFFDILKDAEAGYLLDWLSEYNISSIYDQPNGRVCNSLASIKHSKNMI